MTSVTIDNEIERFGEDVRTMSEEKFPSDIQTQINQKADEYREAFNLSEKVCEVAKTVEGVRPQDGYVVIEIPEGEFPIDAVTLTSYKFLAEKNVLRDLDPEECIRKKLSGGF